MGSIAVLAGATTVLLAGCEYGAMLRPSVIEQLEPPVVRLVDYLPAVDRPNQATVARIYATGGLTRAALGTDGTMRGEVWARPGQMIWTPALIVMPRAGDLDLVFHNPDDMLHIALMPSNGGHQVLELPPRTSGQIRLNLNQPGLYWFGCPVANHVGRGMLGLIIVEGETPAEARLDRPLQPQPAED